MNNPFTFEPAPWIPFRDKTILAKCRNLTREQLVQHPNPDFKIKIVPDATGIWIADMVVRIKESDDLNKRCVMIIPNPCPGVYIQVAEMINRFRIHCRNVHLFAMDEWADQDGNVAPLSYEAGFGHSMMKYFYGTIDEDLRMPLEQVHCHTTKTIKDYTKILEDVGEGGADICYSGPGWTGHIAFIDPDTPEFACSNIDEFINMDARIVTLNPLTIAQNSLHGCFGCSGDITNVPPKAATIGPRDVKNARNRLEIHGLTTMGTFSSWQRMTSRLVTHGPVTPQVPSSILQLWPTTIYLSEVIAAPFHCDEVTGY
ncbi:MAG: hypothetical protein RRZ24_10615 [Clostridia bacterium]